MRVRSGAGWEGCVVGLSQAQWRVVRTRSRQEKRVAEHLVALGAEHYLPTARVRRDYGRSSRTVELPLFPTYLFIRCERARLSDLLPTGRVSQVIDAPNQDRLVEELDQIRRAIEAGVDGFDPYPYLTEGRRVRVRCGAMRGVEGIVDDRRGVSRLVLNVETLGQATSLEIDADLLEPLD